MHVKTFDIKQTAFWNFIKLCGVDSKDNPENDAYDWNKARKSVAQVLFIFGEYEKALKDKKPFEFTELVLNIFEKACALVTEVYNLGPNSTEIRKCLEIIDQSLEVAVLQKCWVYDLLSLEPDNDDFNAALLKCLLNGVAKPGEESDQVLLTKLRYAMLWSRDDLIDYLLQRMSERIEDKQREDIFNSSLLIALKKDKVHALRTLIHRGTGLNMLDVGHNFCYVQPYSKDSVNSKKKSTDEADDEKKLECAAIPAVLPEAFLKVHRGYEWNKKTQKMKFTIKALKVLNSEQKISEAEFKKDSYASSGALEYFRAAKKWDELIDDAKVQNAHFAVYWRSSKSCLTKNGERPSILSKKLKEDLIRDDDMFYDHFCKKFPADCQKILNKYHDYCWQPGHPIPENMRKDLYKQNRLEKMVLKDKIGKPPKPIDKIGKPPFFSSDLTDKTASTPNAEPLLIREHCDKRNYSEKITQIINQYLQYKMERKLAMNLMALEGVYVQLCGPACRYRMGIQGPWFDLFFWNVLQNKRDLAMEMWKHVLHPERSAISAAYLLRQMGKDTKNDPITRTKMLDNADYFENQAVRLLQAAEEDDREKAVQSLDCELNLWRGMSLLDLAVQGQCYRFVKTESCVQAIYARLYGDLAAEGTETLWTNLKIIIGLLTFGLVPAFSRSFLRWAPPPDTPVLRRSTQRRVTPKGYPYSPSENDILKGRKKKYEGRHNNNNKRAKVLEVVWESDDKASRLTKLDLDDLWAPTFGWRERWGCFMSSPYVLVLYNAIWSIVITAIFTGWFWDMKLNPPASPPSRLDADMSYTMSRVEIFLCVYFTSSLLREFSQACVAISQLGSYLEGLKSYLNDKWNVLDLLSLSSFHVAFWWRYACTQPSSLCSSYLWPSTFNSIISSSMTGSTTIDNLDTFCYSLSLFCSWIRILRILYLFELGIVVGIIFRMLRDVVLWFLVYFIFLFAFVMLFIGTSDLDSLIPGLATCKSTNLTKDDLPPNGSMECSSAYVILRPMFQSFGEFGSFFFEMSLINVVLLLVMYFILNLVLINLLIAMMASTYNAIREQASSQRLIFTYELVQEHTRRSVAFPTPFNLIMLIWDFVLFACQYKALKMKFPDYTWGQRLDRCRLDQIRLD
jgi:hypothetical protein